MRKLLILSTGTVEQALTEKIAAADWEICAAQDASEARSLLTEHVFEVGLVVLSNCEAERTFQWLLDLIVVRPKMYWVVALARQCLDRKQLPTIIVERCYDYHTLPIDPQRLIVTLGHAYGMSGMSEITIRQQREVESQYGLVGNSPAMQNVFRGIQKAAEVTVPVLITGENGTGKEQVASSIHEYSTRTTAPFAVMKCAALSAPLMQSELFGHEAGAFLGAIESHIGHLEAANGGTVFLDEIGDLPAELQAALLRFFEEGKVRRMGGVKSTPVNVRIVASTNTDLEKAVQEGRFDEGLYYRLNALHLRIPTLRERKNDVDLLARYFFSKFAAETRTAARGFSRDALEVMGRYDWPGNVRELMNRVRRAVLLSEGPYIVPADLELERRTPSREFITLDDARMAADREAIESTLLRTRFNIARAAQELAISRMTLYRLMEKYDIRRDN